MASRSQHRSSSQRGSKNEIPQKKFDRPELKHLIAVRSLFAANWYSIGLILLHNEDTHQLDLIKCDNRSSTKCCMEMLKLWLKKQPKASWEQLIEALRSEGVGLNSVASKIEKKLIPSAKVSYKKAKWSHSLKSSLSSAQSSQPLLHSPRTFVSDESIESAFQKLSTSISHIMCDVKFSTLKQAVTVTATSPHMAYKSHKILPIIRAATSYEDLSISLSENFYWSFLDLRMMEAMAAASGIPAAKESIDNFKRAYFNKSLKEVASSYTLHKLDTSDYTIIKEVMDKDMTLAELHDQRYFLETKLLGTGEDTFTVCRIVIGSVKIGWLLHIDHVYKAYSMLNKNVSIPAKHLILHLSIPGVLQWEGLPILWREQKVEKIGPFVCEKIPHALPEGLEFTELNSDNVDEIMKLYHNNYSIISKKAIQWNFRHPNYKREFVFGVRESSSKKLVWAIWCVPYHISIKGQLLPVVELQQQGVFHGDKQDELYNIMIREAMDRVSKFGISQSVLTLLTTKIIRPTITFTLWVYNFLCPSHHLPYHDSKTIGLRRMTTYDVPRAMDLTNRYASQFEIGQVFQNEDEFLHYCLCPSTPGYIMYVVENPVNGNMTDLFGFRLHKLTDVGNKVVKSATVSAIINTKSPARQLVVDLLLCAKQEQVDIVSTQQYGLARSIFENLFVQSNQYEYWHIYNYSYPIVEEERCCVFYSSIVVGVGLNKDSKPIITSGASELSASQDLDYVMEKHREEDWKTKGVDLSVGLVRDHLCEWYKESEYIPIMDDYPPYHPKDYTPSISIHYKQGYTASEGMYRESGSKNQSHITTKNISNIYASFEGESPVPYTVLIEGEPGIGMAIISKETALQWADQKLLSNKRLLFVVSMHDVCIKQITDIQSLLKKYFCLDDTVVSKVTEWLIETRGRYITILLDGYDERFIDKSHFMVDSIVGCKVLTECGLIIASRPTALSHLQDIADCRAKVLAFTEEDRLRFIHNAFHNNSDKIDNLKKYLQSKPFINNSSYNPANMTMLLCLADSGISTLPTTQASFYGKFVALSVTHFVKKNEGFVATSLDDLPHEYDLAVNELSRFAFQTLQKSQVIFTKDEVDAACPQLKLIKPYGLGLLAPIQSFKPEEYKSFYFLHCSIQEYLAAYHFASLPNAELPKLLKDTIWKPYYLNTWRMYVGITGGNNPVFKQSILSDIALPLGSKSTISNNVIINKLQRLFLYTCVAESKDHETVSFVNEFFQGGIVDFNNQSLSTNDVYVLSMSLDLVFHNIELQELHLHQNDLQTEGVIKVAKSLQSTTMLTVFDVSNNNIEDEAADDIAAVLFHNTKLEWLYLNNNKFQTEGAIKIVKSLQNTTTLTIFNISCNNIGSEAADDIAAVLSRNTKLQKLMISHNSVQTEGAIKIARSLRYTKTLTVFGFTNNGIGREAADDIAAVLLHNTNLQKLYLSENNLQTEGVIKTAQSLQNTTTLTTFGISNNNVTYEAADDIAAVLYHNNTKLQKLYVNNNYLQTNGIIKIVKSLRNTKTLKVFNISCNNIESKAADEIAAVLSHNKKMKVLNLSNNNLQTEGAIKIAKSLQNTSTLTEFDISNNNIGIEAADKIKTLLSSNTKVKY